MPCWVWQHWQRQLDFCEFEVSLPYKVSSRTQGYTERPCLKQKQKQKQKNNKKIPKEWPPKCPITHAFYFGGIFYIKFYIINTGSHYLMLAELELTI